MCLIAFAIGASTRWPLVIAANRDEFLNRPTRPLEIWRSDSGQEIISGRDLRAGGTWMGITRGGRVAFLTNVREAHPLAASRSRGELVTRWLDQSCDANAFALTLEKHHAAYGGFNLVLGDFQRNAWTWLTNKFATGTSAWHSQSLPPGVYALSNAALNTPWPKACALKTILTAALTAQAGTPEPHAVQALQSSLWAALASRKRAPRENLPSSGVPLALEEALSSAFVESPDHAYGTRSSTVLLASAQHSLTGAEHWNVQVEEHTPRRDRCGQLQGGDQADAIPNHGFTPPQSSCYVIPWYQRQLRR